MDKSSILDLKRRIFLRAALSAVGTSVLNAIGVWLSIYSIIWWYDMPMHFFGGLFTALLVITFLLRFDWFANSSYIKTALIVILITLFIGLVWEGYEIVLEGIAGKKHIFMDSLSDVFFDTAGGLQALFVYFRHKDIVEKKSRII